MILKKEILFTVCCLNTLFVWSQTFTEILGRPTDTSITVSVLFDMQVDTYIEYGVLSGNYSGTTSVVTSVIGQPVITKITGLTAETRYFYRTRYCTVGGSVFLAGSEHNFITQRKKRQFVCIFHRG